MVATHLIDHWDPEDRVFWRSAGQRVAARNLWISISALTLSFAVWMVWSVVVVKLPLVGFRYTTNQLFWLAALPALCGATLRIFYSFAVPVFGGRRWTTVATASLLLPALGIGITVQDPSTPYEVMVVLALLCGLGGGNFASSMAHISYFYPRAQKGYALGMNAGLGNLGVSLVQFVVPAVIGAGLFGAAGGDAVTVAVDGQNTRMWLQNAGFVWVPFIVACTLAVWYGMNDLAEARTRFADQAVIFTRKHNWLMCWLYLGTFGSFIGYSAGLPLLIDSEFPGVDALQYAWFGPLVGALTRPLGGWLSDRLGGARVTLWTFVVMTAGVLAVLHFLPGELRGSHFGGFLLAFLVLFAAAGIGNGSTFRMIPLVFLAERERAAEKTPAAQQQAVRDANKEAAAVLGFSSAIAAYGGFFIPKSWGSSIALTGGPEAALIVFVAFYLTCIAITWWYYGRRYAPLPC